MLVFIVREAKKVILCIYHTCPLIAFPLTTSTNFQWTYTLSTVNMNIECYRYNNIINERDKKTKRTNLFIGGLGQRTQLVLEEYTC